MWFSKRNCRDSQAAMLSKGAKRSWILILTLPRTGPAILEKIQLVWDYFLLEIKGYYWYSHQSEPLHRVGMKVKRETWTFPHTLRHAVGNPRKCSGAPTAVCTFPVKAPQVLSSVLILDYEFHESRGQVYPAESPPNHTSLAGMCLISELRIWK